MRRENPTSSHIEGETIFLIQFLYRVSSNPSNDAAIATLDLSMRRNAPTRRNENESGGGVQHAERTSAKVSLVA